MSSPNRWHLDRIIHYTCTTANKPHKTLEWKKKLTHTHTNIFYTINLTWEVRNASSPITVTSVLHTFTLSSKLKTGAFPQEEKSDKEGDKFYNLINCRITQNNRAQNVRELTSSSRLPDLDPVHSYSEYLGADRQPEETAATSHSWNYTVRRWRWGKSTHTYVDIGPVSHPASKLFRCKAAHLQLVRVAPLGLPLSREVDEGWCRIHVQLR